jgi:dipeptidyl aminopeptidase/acylaminoacyl peptidase
MKVYLILLALLLAGCAGTSSPTPTTTPLSPTDTPAPTQAPTATAVEQLATDPPAAPTEPPTLVPQIEENTSPLYPADVNDSPDSPYPAPAQTVGAVTIQGAEGLNMAGMLYLPSGAGQPVPAILLLHMLGSNKEAWGNLPEKLADAGYAVLAIDMRGHGETGGTIDWNKAAEDHQMVWNYLTQVPGVDKDRTAVFGASIGANMALIAGANEPAIRSVVLLSPGLDYSGVTTQDPLASYGGRPLLIAASKEDTVAATSSETLKAQAQGEVELELYDGASHGTNMLTAQADLTQTILDWLDQYLK